jgi:hypothetical protein
MATVGHDSCHHLLHKIQITTRGTLCKLQYEKHKCLTSFCHTLRGKLKSMNHFSSDPRLLLHEQVVTASLLKKNVLECVISFSVPRLRFDCFTKTGRCQHFRNTECKVCCLAAVFVWVLFLLMHSVF